MAKIVIGILGLIASIGGTIGYYHFPVHLLAQSDLTVISGTITRATLGLPLKGGQDLYIWISGREIPFFINANKLYPSDAEAVRPGCRAAIGIHRGWLEAKQKAKRPSQYDLLSMDLDGRPIYTIDDYNTQQIKTAQTMKWLLPMFAVGSIFLIYSGSRRR